MQACQAGAIDSVQMLLHYGPDVDHCKPGVGNHLDVSDPSTRVLVEQFVQQRREIFDVVVRFCISLQC